MGSVPMLVGSQIHENHIDWESAKRISKTSNDSLPASRLTAGDLVTVRVGEPGVTAVVPPELDGCNCASMMIVRQHLSFSSLWLCYVMNSYIGRSQIEHLQYGTAQKQFNISDAVNFLYPVPPLPEQRLIAQALSDVDALSVALDKLIAKKRNLKTATMQQLLTGKKRLLGFGAGQGYKQSAIGVILEDWFTPTIGEFFDFKNGLNKAKKFFGSGTPIVNYMDVFMHPSLLSKDVLGKVNVIKDEIRAYGVKQGDVFFTRTSETVEEIGCAAVLLEDIQDGVFSGFVLRARPKVFDIDLLFKKYCFASTIIRKQITSTSSYTTRALTNGKLLSQVVIPYPVQKEEQRAIATVLSDMDAEITALETRLAKTQAIKQGMMQELLTGRTRLV